MERTKVDSSMIISMGYDPDEKVMEIEFKGGKVYQYSPITAEGYTEFFKAPSLGKFFDSKIKNNPTINCFKLP